MANAKKILVTTVSHEILIARVNNKSEFREFCDGCSAETKMLTVDEAVSFSGVSTFEILRRLQEREVHFLETDGGHLFVCKNSLEAGQYEIVSCSKIS